MADSDNTTALPGATTRRALLAGAAALAGAGAIALPAQGATTGLSDDGPFFELFRQRQVVRDLVEKLGDQIPTHDAVLYPLMWTPEEMAEHRIKADSERPIDKPRRVDLAEIERNDWWDSPLYPETKFHEIEDDVSSITSLVVTRPKSAPAEEMAAWEARCAARRALVDAKNTAWVEANSWPAVEAAEQKYDAAHDELDRIEEEIRAYRPVTLAGVLEKMRFYRDYDRDSFDGDPDDLDWSAKLFLSALADLERVTGGVA